MAATNNSGFNKASKIIILSGLSFFLCLALFVSGLLDTFEKKTFDLFSRHLNPENSSQEIVIIQVDQQSMDNLSKEGINWPWPRQVYAPFFEYLALADAVFVDILFTEPSSYGQRDDEVLAEAVKKASNVYLPLFLTRKGRDMTPEDRKFLEKVALNDRGEVPSSLSYCCALTPIDVLKPCARGGGNVTISPDSDGVYRSVPLIFKAAESAVPNLVLSYLLNKGEVRIRDGSFFIDEKKIPLASDRLLLRFSRSKEPFRTISAADIVKSYVDLQESRKPAYTMEYFRGKKVFIGLTAAGLYDLKPTAVSSVSTGVLIHATTLDNLVRRDFIAPVDHLYLYCFMLLVCLCISYAVITHFSIYRNLSVLFIAAGITIFVPALLFRNGLYMNIIPPALSLITSFILAASFSYATEGKERRFIRRAFSQYMDDTLVDYVLKNPAIMKPGGHRRRVTVFFADIAGFTSMAERLPAEDTAMVLHRILNAFTEVIIHNGGVIDKYIGDCIMAFWGAPLDSECDETNACFSAIECMQALGLLNQQFAEEGLTEISMRIGIHSGEAITGNLGSARLFDYTVIGDTVNLASRLEAANKFFGTRIMVSEETLSRTEGVFFARDLGLVEVKGKSVPVRIFELISERHKVSPGVQETVLLFDIGRDLFRAKKWTEALEVFNRILERNTLDGPSLFYKQRCEYFLAAPPLTADCDIIKMSEK